METNWPWNWRLTVPETTKMMLVRALVTNLDSILKSWDISLVTNVYLVKAIVFPVVMYRCESWAIKKTEHRGTDAFKLVVLRKTLESSLDSKEIKPVNPKGNQPWIFTGRTDAEAEAQYFGHLMQRAISLEKTLMLGKTEGRRRGVTEDEMVGWHHRHNGHEFVQIPGDSREQRNLACCSPVE